MTVFVDDFRVPARIGRINGRWSHLTATTKDELHAFAAKLGMQRSWFQERCKYGKCDPCPHWHYDVTDSVREQALALGAESIDIRDLGALVSLRRRQTASDDGMGMPEPCQPIGCDNGHHLRGCWYASADEGDPR